MEFRRGVGWSSPALTLTSWHLWFLLPGDDAPLFLPGRTKMGHCKSPSCQASLQICLIVQGTYKYLQWIPVNQPYLGSLEGCLHGICGKQSEQTKRTLTGIIGDDRNAPPFNHITSLQPLLFMWNENPEQYRDDQGCMLLFLWPAPDPNNYNSAWS